MYTNLLSSGHAASRSHPLFDISASHATACRKHQSRCGIRFPRAWIANVSRDTIIGSLLAQNARKSQYSSSEKDRDYRICNADRMLRRRRYRPRSEFCIKKSCCAQFRNVSKFNAVPRNEFAANHPFAPFQNSRRRLRFSATAHSADVGRQVAFRTEGDRPPMR